MLTAEQIVQRRGFVGASEIASVVGVNPYESAIDVWLRKTGRDESDGQENLAMWFGNEMEAPVADRYALLHGIELERCDSIVHPEHPRFGATLDRVYKDRSRIVEIKVPGPFSKGWTDPEKDPSGYPEQYLCQIMAQMAVTGIRAAHLVACSQRFWWEYDIEYSETLAGQLIEIVNKFWRDYVENDVCPPVDGSESSTRYLRSLFPNNNGILLPATPEDDVLVLRRQVLTARLKATQKMRDACDNLLRQRIGDADGISGDGWRCTYRMQKDSIAKKAVQVGDVVKKGSRVLRFSGLDNLDEVE